MSDSDSDLTNVFTFQNETTTASARGPNTNINNITGLSFRHNVMTSTMQMPRHMEHSRYAESNYDPKYGNGRYGSRYAESNYDQRSLYSRRETSPMSIMSACDARQRTFNNSYYARGMSSQRSVMNGRSGSPMSIRSIDSNASVSAHDIATAFKNMTFNKYDLRLIKDAYNKFMKHRVRKKIEKRRNLRLFLKGSRRRSGGDSGDLGSDSSISSDDRSTKTSNYKENMSSCRSTKTDITDFRRKIKESNIYKDCTDIFKRSSGKAIVAGPSHLNNTVMNGFHVPPVRNMQASNPKSTQNRPIGSTLKDRFQNGFLLPSQRFHKSVASTTIPESIEKDANNEERSNSQNGAINRNQSIRNCETDSDQDNMFRSSKQRNTNNNIVTRKRSVDSDDDICLPSQKRTKILSPCKNDIEFMKSAPKEQIVSTTSNANDKTNDFVFAKPTFPVRKSANLKTKEKLISKSAAPISDILQAPINLPANIQSSQDDQEKDKVNEQDEPSNATQNSTDMSMRPSFIKRKLFTQRLDVTEKNNTSMDNLANSPQNSIYGAIQKEKHKARKLQQVTTQSCLSRDVQQDESNLLDLIHKIVPPDKINNTTQANKTDLHNSKNKTEDNSDKFDVTSIISNRNIEDETSDTYTDEEIFNFTVKEATKENVTKKPSPKIKEKDCRIVVERLPLNCNMLQTSKVINNNVSDIAKKSVQKCVKTFWDTDFESDTECQSQNKKKEPLNILKEKGAQKEAPKFEGFSGINRFNSKKPTTAAPSTNVSTFLNNTVNSIQKFTNTSLKIRSHRTPKRKKFDQTRDEDVTQTYFEPQSKKLKISCEKDSDNKKSKAAKAIEQLSKQKNKTPPKAKKPASKTDKTVDSIKESPTKKQVNTNKIEVKNKRQEQDLKENKRNDINRKIVKNVEKDTNKLDESVKSHVKKRNVKSKENEKNIKKSDSSVQDTITTRVENSNGKKHASLKPDEKSKPKTNNTIHKNYAQNKNKLTKSIIKQVPKEKQPMNIKPQDENKETQKNEQTTKKNNRKGKTPQKKDAKENKILTSQKEKPINKNNNVTNDTIVEENNNSNRSLRSCRLSKQNSTLNESNQTLNASMNRTLRSRVVLSVNITHTNAKTTNTKDAKSRVSEDSFSLAVNAKAMNKKNGNVNKLSNSRILRSHDVDTSDVSFSLKAQDTPLPKKAAPVKKNVIKSRDTSMFVSKNDSRTARLRIPNKRYLIC